VFLMEIVILQLSIKIKKFVLMSCNNVKAWTIVDNLKLVIPCINAIASC
jgi:hypothetical protein